MAQKLTSFDDLPDGAYVREAQLAMPCGHQPYFRNILL